MNYANAEERVGDFVNRVMENPPPKVANNDIYYDSEQNKNIVMPSDSFAQKHWMNYEKAEERVADEVNRILSPDQSNPHDIYYDPNTNENFVKPDGSGFISKRNHHSK